MRCTWSLGSEHTTFLPWVSLGTIGHQTVLPGRVGALGVVGSNAPTANVLPTAVHMIRQLSTQGPEPNYLIYLPQNIYAGRTRPGITRDLKNQLRWALG